MIPQLSSTFLESTNWLFCRISLTLGWSAVFFVIRFHIWRGEGQEYYICAIVLSRDTRCPFIDDFNCNHLVELLAVRSVHCKVTIFNYCENPMR